MGPSRQHRRRYGKSDEADAIGAARAVLAGEALGVPKAGTGQVEAIRLLRVARRSAMKARTQAGNQIHAVVDTAPEELRRGFIDRPTETIVAEVARFHRSDEVVIFSGWEPNVDWLANLRSGPAKEVRIDRDRSYLNTVS